MTYFVFVDESGTLPEPSERFFVVAAVGTRNPRELGRVVKKVREWLKQRGKRYQNITELRFSSAEQETRIKFLEILSTVSDVQIYVLILEKDRSQIIGTPENYAKAAWPLLAKILENFPQAEFILDKQFSKPTVHAALNQALELRAGRDLLIEHGDSQNETCLQIADFIAGAGMAKYRREEEEYLEIVRSKILFERMVSWSEIEKW